MNDLVRDPRQLGNVIRRARKKRGWTQGMLAEKAALRQETISLVETGSSTTRLQTLLSILAALDLEFQVAPRSKSSSETIGRIFL